MTVMIKGMKLPKSCCDCDLLPADIDWDEQWECPITEKIVHKYVEERKGKPSDCPLIEIPPHGRLIDADELEGEFEYCSEEDRLGRLLDAPTVIESEEEE